MPRGVAKSDLPSKICLSCGQLMVWRKRWERCWETVKFCSDRCRTAGRKTTAAPGRG